MPRMPGAREHKGMFNAEWAPEELHLFKPDRWLVESGGQLKFDPRAGPQHNFGGGPKGCFGEFASTLR